MASSEEWPGPEAKVAEDLAVGATEAGSAEAGWVVADLAEVGLVVEGMGVG